MVSQPRGPFRLSGSTLKLSLDSTNLRYLLSDINELGFIVKDDIAVAMDVASEQIRQSLHEHFFTEDKVYTSTYLDSIEFQVNELAESVDFIVDVVPQGLEAGELPYYSNVLEFGSEPGAEIDHWGGEAALRNRLKRWASVKGIPSNAHSKVIRSIIRKIKSKGRIASPLLGEFFNLYPGASGNVQFRIGAPRRFAFEIIHNELMLFAGQSEFQGISTAKISKSGSVQLRNRKGQFTSKVLKP